MQTVARKSRLFLMDADGPMRATLESIGHRLARAKSLSLPQP